MSNQNQIQIKSISVSIHHSTIDSCIDSFIASLIGLYSDSVIPSIDVHFFALMLVLSYRFVQLRISCMSSSSKLNKLKYLTVAFLSSVQATLENDRSGSVCRLLPIEVELESASNTQASACWYFKSLDLLSSV